MQNIVKKLIRDYIYFSETLDDIMEISSSAESKFRSAMMEQDPEALKALTPDVDVNKSNVDIEDIDAISFEDKAFKKLFRKLAVKCHPDKIRNATERETAFLKENYERITDANNTYNWGLLLRAAYDLDVRVDELNDEQIENITENIESIKGNITKYESSMAYTWFTLRDSPEKEKYLQQCADIFNNSMKSKLD